ncbi:AbiJ-related protein [Amycolatopsis thermoflava]|uniref:AbiJ-related protein n=1 Tax=Amycolatopsis thermoflava TaxID=84480 RepID=UPI00056C272F|nr:hypothetical protein [Amycolatopsis thermoflava]
MPTGKVGVDVEAEELVRELVATLHPLRHVDLDMVGATLGLAIPSEHPEPSQVENAESLSKRQRLDQAFLATPPSQYDSVCARFLERGGLSPELRSRVEDLLWSREDWPPITARIRREVAEALDACGEIWLEGDGLMALVKRYWVLPSSNWSFDWTDPYEPVVRHMIRNPGDWTTVQFFKEIGALDGGGRRFVLFLEGLLSSSVNPDEARQRKLAAAILPILNRAGLQVIESGTVDGYPDFAVVTVGTRPRPTQLILFAGQHGKPELRVSDVLDQSIEVLTGEDKVLAYDVPVGQGGLTWHDLESWWSHRREIPAGQAKGDLWRRLVQACTNASPAQRAFLTTYYEYAKDRDPLYALLPEVWLHWDPVARRQRGEDAYLNQRIDFLMLLPGLRRVVLEVDGEQHYATADHQPSPRIYSETTRGDRDLRLSGYEVYRFSGYELTKGRITDTVSEFFDRLLRR